MRAPTKEEGPGRNRGTSSSPSNTSLPCSKCGYSVTEPWIRNWHRMVERCRVDPAFREYCESGVRRWADELRAHEVAGKYYGGCDAA